MPAMVEDVLEQIKAVSTVVLPRAALRNSHGGVRLSRKKNEKNLYPAPYTPPPYAELSVSIG